MFLRKAVPVALLAVSETTAKDPVFFELHWKLQQMTEEIDFLNRIFF